MAGTSNQESLVGKGTRFLSECNDELRKVVRPNRQETIQATLVTLVIVIFVAVVLSASDLIFGWLLKLILAN